MPTNLQEKIGILLRDIERMEKSQQIKTVENFILKEMEMTKAERLLDIHDLSMIRSRAINITIDTAHGATVSGRPLAMNSDACNALAWTKACWEFFRGKGMMHYDIGFED